MTGDRNHLAGIAELRFLFRSQQRERDMSKDKKPQAGEWWFYNGGGIKVYIVGTASDGSCVYESKTGEPEGNDDWSGWHHEPRCTGWDWQPEPEPEWFDLTPFDGHVLRERDKGFGGNPSEWLSPCWPITTTVLKAKSWGWKQFRCLLKDAPPELVKPVESPKSRWRTPQLNENPHPDAQYWNRSLQTWVRRGCPKDRYSKMETYRVPVCVMCGTRDVIAGTDTCVDCTNDAIAGPNPATQTIVFHEVLIPIGIDEHYAKEWRSHIPRGSIPTGRTETREVVR
jgi:hypothetical protein